MANSKKLSKEHSQKLIETLKSRFDANLHRHKTIMWADVLYRLAANPEKLWSLHQMEITGGEPDVVGVDDNTGAIIFYDCTEESPKGRRSCCYDREALESRKDYPPKNTAIDMAIEMGVELLTEAQYRALQQLGKFDLKTSSWLKTPSQIREMGGAIFGDCRFNHVFVYHNGAQSYYAGRGFRASVSV